MTTVRQEIRTLGQRLHFLETKQVFDSGQYQTQIGQVLDILHGLNASGITHAGGNDGETTTTDRLEQDIQAKVNTTVQEIERSVEVFKHTTNRQMQAVFHGLWNEKVLRKRSAERVMGLLDNHIQKLVTTITDRFDKHDAAILELTKQVDVVSDMIETVHTNLKENITTLTDRFDEQDAANQELMKQVNLVSDRIVTGHNNLKEDVTDMNDTLRHYGNQCVLDNAVVLKTIEDTVNASQCRTNANEETLKAIDDSSKNPTGTRETCTTCPPDWTLFPSTNSCYKLFPTKATSDEAVQNCIDVNSHITDITSVFENEFLVSLTGGNPTWLGLTDEDTEGDWRWKHNNHAASYVNWRSSWPAGGTDYNCAYIGWYTNQWYDYPCSYRFRYICKTALPRTC